MVAAADIKDGRGLTLDSCYLLEQFQSAIKAVNCWCDDNFILKNATPQVFTPSCQESQ